MFQKSQQKMPFVEAFNAVTPTGDGMISRLKLAYNAFRKHLMEERTRAKIDAALKIVRSIPEGQALYQEMLDSGVPILIDHRKHSPDHGGSYDSTNEVILLPTTKFPLYMWVGTLFHEPRHMEQYNWMGNKLRYPALNIYERLTLQRIMEGDAYAFQWSMLRKIIEGEKKPKYTFREEFNHFQETEDQVGHYEAHVLKFHLDSYAERPNGTPPVERLLRAFKRAAKTPLTNNLPDVRCFLVPGTDPHAPCYMGRRSNKAIWTEAYGHVRKTLPLALKKLGIPA